MSARVMSARDQHSRPSPSLEVDCITPLACMLAHSILVEFAINDLPPHHPWVQPAFDNIYRRCVASQVVWKCLWESILHILCMYCKCHLHSVRYGQLLALFHAVWIRRVGMKRVWPTEDRNRMAEACHWVHGCPTIQPAEPLPMSTTPL
jgi:hypothetical protein